MILNPFSIRIIYHCYIKYLYTMGIGHAGICYWYLHQDMTTGIGHWKWPRNLFYLYFFQNVVLFAHLWASIFYSCITKSSFCIVSFAQFYQSTYEFTVFQLENWYWLGYDFFTSIWTIIWPIFSKFKSLHNWSMPWKVEF